MQITKWTGREARALRLALRMSLRGFAETLGAGYRTVSDWESKLEAIKPTHQWQAALDVLLARADHNAHERVAQLLASENAEVSTALHENTARPRSAAPSSLSDHYTDVDSPLWSVAGDDGRPELPQQEEDQRCWRAVRSDLNSRRSYLAKLAVGLYPESLRLPRTGLIASRHWIPQEPIPLNDLVLAWSPGPQGRALKGTEAFAAGTLPLRDHASRFERYTAAIRYLDPPRLFENRPSFRLLDVDLHGTKSLRFGLSNYFEKLDVSEALGHEFAAAASHTNIGSGDEGSIPSWTDLPFRRAIGDPFDLSTRAVNPAITTLTILHDEQHGEASFLMHWRDASKVATAGGLYDVIPAGEFQPASIDPWHNEADLDLWRNIVREYSEELLGEPEHDGSRGDPLDYDHWPLYRNLCRARADGLVRAYFLGIGLDALTLAATIPTVVVIDRRIFAEIFGAPVAMNAEGIVVADQSGPQALPGVPFTEANVDRFLEAEPIAPPGAACLALSWTHRHRLLPTMPT